MRRSLLVLVSSLVLLSSPPFALSQDSQPVIPEVAPLLTQIVYNRIANLSNVFPSAFINKWDFCIRDPEKEWNEAFNFSSNLDFLEKCLLKLVDFERRLCTAAEIKFYFSTIGSGGQSGKFLKPNKNCNSSSWVSGCEPGWSCSVAVTENVDLNDSKDMPARTSNSQPCCEGFFCPRGLTCMIPCPLGAYCPLAKLNSTTGLCDPYLYQLPPGDPNHGCGGADIWADVGSSEEVFCPAGSYCPTTTLKNNCSSGYYCRMGSTAEKKCFKLTSCDQNTANQDIHAYGIMLIVALSTLLLIIYNCSDQVLTIRERRLAKFREAAARSARETAHARERWKAAKDIAKKRAIELKTQFSRTFSRRQALRTTDPLNVPDQCKTRPEDALLPPAHTSSSNDLEEPISSTMSRKGPSNDRKVMHEIEEDLYKNEVFNIEIGDKKKGVLKGKKMTTDSQIFKYAYGQLEKEKAQQQRQQNKNLTFSGVISMATSTEVRTRPMIEIAFRDLTLTLKGKKKHLLRCVTGKLMPGHITAIMGPSGAGKTTFLSALTGKAIGCTVSGLILINGKEESIHSYKKITGFVPQDDIVHGNLTVEENLWFSARCRLSADMPKADKVLVVERVIESLGLQAVRDSLVGTVEKRGISGGQRKRVNVGLEMVMEPSLLFLDEPTSGLDSSSSQLLLRALRREALEGVNISMVVHQPSYALFMMFDDLLLLAKGGLTVYHGPVKRVEEYFAGLGITVPEHVNPPDHFIDVLEGIVKPSASGSVDYKQLPIRWMLHNGYQIPPDMQHAAGMDNFAMAIPNNETNPDASGQEEQSFAGELWQDVKSQVELKRDHIRLNFLIARDLSNRKTPAVFKQYKYFLGRVGKQRLRESRMQAIDFIILLLAGACLGILAKVSDEDFGVVGYTYTVIAVSLLCKIAALRSFSLDKLHYWRESASSMSSLAYFLSKDTIDHFNTVIKPVVYLSMFYFFNNPRSSFAENYVIMLCLVYCVTGIAYAFAIFLEPGAAQLWSVLLPVVLTLIATQKTSSEIMKRLASLCYTKWALEAFIITNAQRYSGVWLITRCGALMRRDYDLNDWGLCISILILYGAVFRAIAYICLVTFQKKK